MNKSDLKNFAINARLALLQRVADRAALGGHLGGAVGAVMIAAMSRAGHSIATDMGSLATMQQKTDFCSSVRSPSSKIGRMRRAQNLSPTVILAVPA